MYLLLSTRMRNLRIASKFFLSAAATLNFPAPEKAITARSEGSIVRWIEYFGKSAQKRVDDRIEGALHREARGEHMPASPEF